jgi:hypothetical protein
MRNSSQGGCGSEHRENQDRGGHVVSQQPTVKKLENGIVEDYGKEVGKWNS